ncbi:MAG: hypothetical protein NC299_02965 [Lachnospiraceae bacterium]|nr:hypothetical protein [Ruminococcus sp.]MCM1274312.1 hypothetical protein [Lachnospiraceae bacterium]
MVEVVFAGFDGRDNPARLLVERVCAPCRKVVLPNDKALSAAVMRGETARKPSAVIMTGQKPAIRDKIAVERFARDGGAVLETSADCDKVVRFFRENGYGAYPSSGVGNSYCNAVYAAVLKIYPRGLFLHIPTLENISDFGALVKALDGFLADVSQNGVTL